MKMLKIPLVLSVIDSELPVYKENNNRLYDMAVDDDKKVWIGGHSCLTNRQNIRRCCVLLHG